MCVLNRRAGMPTGSENYARRCQTGEHDGALPNGRRTAGHVLPLGVQHVQLRVHSAQPAPSSAGENEIPKFVQKVGKICGF